jgi:hypothetical protein
VCDDQAAEGKARPNIPLVRKSIIGVWLISNCVALQSITTEPEYDGPLWGRRRRRAVGTNQFPRRNIRRATTGAVLVTEVQL